MIVVPLRALVRSPVDPNGYAVYVAEDRAGKTIAALRTIQIGRMVGNGFEAANGLQVRDRVLVRFAPTLYDGEEIAVQP